MLPFSEGALALLRLEIELPNSPPNEILYALCYPSSPWSKRANNGPEWMHNMWYGRNTCDQKPQQLHLNSASTDALLILLHMNHSHPLILSLSHPTYTIHAPVLSRTSDPNNSRA